MPENEIEYAALQTEIAYLTKELKNQKASKQAACALVRFCRSSQESIDAFLHEQGLNLWHTLPLANSTYPNLLAWQKQLEKLSYEKNHDPLTALPNRRHFEKTLKQEIGRAVRHKSSLALCILDVDNFKIFNDTYGHHCGDMVLQALASVLKKEIRGIDLPARVGGEEFAIILPGTNILQAQSTLARIQKHIHDTAVFCPGRQTALHFTCSFGLTCFRGSESEDIEQLVQLADQAMYAAKKAGKNQIEILLPQTSRQERTTMVQHTEKQFLFGTKGK